MARRNRDLAGLAALGALGYAMFGGKKRTDGGAPVVDRGTMLRQQAASAAGFEDTRGLEGGIEPLGLRRNEETGDLYDPTGRVLGRPAVRPAATRPTARMPSADEDFPPVATPAPRRRNVAGDYTRKMGATAEEIAAYNRIKSLEREPDYVSRRKPNVIYDAQGREVRPLKKGGKVKKMASGGMTSASKRADGIATKGKTKCKMY